MLKEIKIIKQQPADPDFWHATESSEQLSQEVKSKTVTTEESFIGSSDNLIGGESSINKKENLVLVDLTGSSKEDKPRHVWHNPMGWNVTDGDYTGSSLMNEEPGVRFRKVNKRLQKIYFVVALLVVAIMVLVFATIAASRI